MVEIKPVCLVCQTSSQEVPLISLTYQDKMLYICPQHLPLLIHHPEELTNYLPNAGQFKAAGD